MADGTIVNEQITASSQFLAEPLQTLKGTVERTYEPWRARLGNIRSWATATQYPTSPWIQVDFIDSVAVTGIQIQGGNYTDPYGYYINWIKTFQVQYGDGDTEPTFIMDGDQAMVSICQYHCSPFKIFTEHREI